MISTFCYCSESYFVVSFKGEFLCNSTDCLWWVRCKSLLEFLEGVFISQLSTEVDWMIVFTPKIIIQKGKYYALFLRLLIPCLFLLFTSRIDVVDLTMSFTIRVNYHIFRPCFRLRLPVQIIRNIRLINETNLITIQACVQIIIFHIRYSLLSFYHSMKVKFCIIP